MALKSYFQLRELIRNIYYSYFKKFEFGEKDFPRIIQLETSIVCNGKCKMCPSHQIVRKAYMDEALFKKIIQECKGTRLESIHPFFFNEPFLFPKFLDWLRHIRQELPSVKIAVTTNGSLFNKSLCDTIANENLIDELSFSMDSYTPEMFKLSRGFDNFENVLKTINYLKTNSKMNISVNFTITDYNLSELDKFKSFWTKKGVPFFVNYDDGRKEGKPFVNRRYNRPCKQPFDYMTILTTGEVVLCDMDALGKSIIGDVSKNSIKEVWSNTDFKQIRESHKNKLRDKIPLCRKCNITWT